MTIYHKMSKTKRFQKYALATVRAAILSSAYYYIILLCLSWVVISWPIKFLFPTFRMKLKDFLCSWSLAMVTAFSYSAGYDLEESGDDISSCLGKYTLVISNHASTADVPFLMANFTSKPNVAPNVMWILRQEVKHTSFGVICKTHDDFFLSPGKENRKASMAALRYHLEYFFKKYSRKWIMLFPEGKLLKNIQESNRKFAAKHDLPQLEHVALPRVGAIKTIMDSLYTNNKNEQNFLDYVLDITILYPKGPPFKLADILTGLRDPCVIRMHYRLYKIKEVPKDEEALTAWFYERFYEKDKILEEYSKTGMIGRGGLPARLIRQNYFKLFFASLFLFLSLFVHYFMLCFILT